MRSGVPMDPGSGFLFYRGDLYEVFPRSAVEAHPAASSVIGYGTNNKGQQEFDPSSGQPGAVVEALNNANTTSGDGTVPRSDRPNSALVALDSSSVCSFPMAPGWHVQGNQRISSPSVVAEEGSLDFGGPWSPGHLADGTAASSAGPNQTSVAGRHQSEVRDGSALSPVLFGGRPPPFPKTPQAVASPGRAVGSRTRATGGCQEDNSREFWSSNSQRLAYTPRGVNVGDSSPRVAPGDGDVNVKAASMDANQRARQNPRTPRPARSAFNQDSFSEGFVSPFSAAGERDDAGAAMGLSGSQQPPDGTSRNQLRESGSVPVRIPSSPSGQVSLPLHTQMSMSSMASAPVSTGSVVENTSERGFRAATFDGRAVTDSLKVDLSSESRDSSLQATRYLFTSVPGLQSAAFGPLPPVSPRQGRRVRPPELGLLAAPAHAMKNTLALDLAVPVSVSLTQDASTPTQASSDARVATLRASRSQTGLDSLVNTAKMAAPTSPCPPESSMRVSTPGGRIALAPSSLDSTSRNQLARRPLTPSSEAQLSGSQGEGQLDDGALKRKRVWSDESKRRKAHREKTMSRLPVTHQAAETLQKAKVLLNRVDKACLNNASDTIMYLVRRAGLDLDDYYRGKDAEEARKELLGSSLA